MYGIARQRCRRFVSVYQEPRPNVFNHASVIGLTPFAARVKEAATLKVTSHDADTLARPRNKFRAVGFHWNSGKRAGLRAK